MKTGYGIYTWPDNSVYQGEWLQNMISGKGTYQWGDGRIYIGDWRDNDMHG